MKIKVSKKQQSSRKDETFQRKKLELDDRKSEELLFRQYPQINHRFIVRQCELLGGGLFAVKITRWLRFRIPLIRMI